MPFISTELVLDYVRQVMEEHFDKRRKELTNGPEKAPTVKKWVSAEWAFPEVGDRGDYPKGVVNFDGDRLSERREQDTGETATIPVTVSIYFSLPGGDKDEANKIAVRYGDGVLYTLMREAKVKRPKDSTAIPGLFRIWPDSMRVGQVQESDLMGCEVKATVTVDSSFTAAV